jgi:hypothetical protein
MSITKLIPGLLAIITGNTVALTNPDFEAAPFSSGWTVTGAPVSVTGIAPDSLKGVRFTASGQAMRQTVTWPADWFVECYFATRVTTARALSVIIDAGTVNAINFRYENGSFAAFNGASWSTLPALGTVTASVDANADGDLADAGDTKNVYRLRITGHGWGAAGATYDVQVSDANGTAFTRSVSGLAHYQVANSAITNRPSAVKFGTEFGSNPGWWLDDVSSQDEVPPAELPEIAWLIASPENVTAGEPVTLTWAATSADTLSLSPGGPPLTGASTSAVVNPAATTTYTLTATNTGGSVTRNVTVGVGGTAQPLRINEFMASNLTGLTDEDGDRSDWIELHNPNAWSVNAGGLSLTDDVTAPDKWVFPTQTIAPGGYLVVFASSKDRRIAGGQLHTNFSLASGGEYLALMDRSGTAIQQFAPAYAPQTDDASTDGTAFFNTPTPGAANLPGPYLSAPAHTLQPDGSFLITVRAVDAAAVSLKYRVMYGAEQAIAMSDSAGTWSGAIPAAVAAPGQMLRWYFTATDAASRTARLPAYLMTTAPQYLGTVIANPAVTSQLRVFEWFVDPANFAAADTLTGTRCSVFHLGEFYDNVLVHLRGATTASFHKKPHKFEFHDSQPFRFRADLPRVDEINVNAAFSDGSYLRDYLAYRDLLAAAIPTPSVEPLRVQRNGAFHSIGVMIENVDRRFLRRHNLDEAGPLYKATGNGSWLTGTTGFETRNGAVLTDLAAFTAGIAATNANRQTYLFDNTNLPAVVNYLAANVLGSIYNPQKNYYAFRNTRKGEWQIIAWDRDFAYGDIWLGGGDTRYPAGGPCPNIISNERIEHAATNQDLRGGSNRLFETVMATPLAREMFYRRLRTLLDGHFATGNVESILDDWQPRMKQEADLDRAAWGFAPGPGGPYSFRADNFDTAVGRIRTEYLPARRTYLLLNNTAPNNGVSDPGGTFMRGLVPAAQTASPAIVIQSAETSPASGNQDEEYIELRNPTADAADLSGWRISGGVQHTLQPGTVIPAGGSLFLTPDAVTFRVRTVSPKAGESRFVQGNYDGHLSNFSEVITLSDAEGNAVATFTTPNTPTPVQQFLRISEFHYHPGPAAPDAEFVEVVNTSTSLTLDLAGVQFTSGFDFTFPAGFTLAPGARTVVVLNSAAFATAWPGNTATIAGTFSAGRLSNGGERLKIDDATGSTVEDFTYDNTLPWPVQADGTGATLARVNLLAPSTDPLNWRATTATPGAAGTVSLATWLAARGLSDPAADPDGNGYTALAEYALGADLAPGLPLVVPDATGSTVTFRRRLNSEGVTIVVEQSADLTAWTLLSAPVTQRTVHADGTESITLLLPAAPRGFCRLIISL